MAIIELVLKRVVPNSKEKLLTNDQIIYKYTQLLPGL
jgi:hypothetical protein